MKKMFFEWRKRTLIRRRQGRKTWEISSLGGVSFVSEFDTVIPFLNPVEERTFIRGDILVRFLSVT